MSAPKPEMNIEHDRDAVCSRCLVKLTRTGYGWKHATGGGGPKSCGQTPIPMHKDKITEGIKHLFPKRSS